VHITLKGTFSRDYGEVTGTAREVPDVPFKGELTKLSA